MNAGLREVRERRKYRRTFERYALRLAAAWVYRLFTHLPAGFAGIHACVRRYGRCEAGRRAFTRGSPDDAVQPIYGRP